MAAVSLSNPPQQKHERTWLYLIALGGFLVFFSLFASSPQVIAFMNESLRSGRVLDEDVVFWLKDMRWRGVILGAFVIILGAMRKAFGERLRAFLEAPGAEEIRTSPAVDLFVVSVLSLFAELLIIRWLSVEMRIFAYFKNVPLISCFLGLGLGAAAAGKKERLNPNSFPFWFSLFAAVVVLLGPRLVFLNPAGADEYIWGIGKTSGLGTQIISMVLFIATVIFVFVWNTRLFVTLGYMTGRMLTAFDSLKAYSINILGGLAGVWLFTAVSYVSTPPAVWFAITFALFFILIRKNRRVLSVMLVPVVLLLVFLAGRLEPHQVFWSPYQKITLIPTFVDSKLTGKREPSGFSLKVNEDGHQTAMNYSAAFLRDHAGEDSRVARVLELPFRARNPKKALIVGSGMGNDVAAALRSGVDEIVAVEIDPKILELGRRFHPEHPYASPRVRAVNDDARAFFRKTHERFDIVVFGILDSHTQFSTMSNLRLDNYVYTQESLADARALLKPGGLLSITFGGDAKNMWIGGRFYRMLAAVFGKDPVALDLGRMMFISGDDLTRDELTRNPYWKGSFPDAEVRFDDAKKLPPATDDWPFLYMKARKVPNVYLVMIAVLGLVAWRFLHRTLGRTRIDLHFFLLGTAFLLLETKAITELALVYGTTWIVNAVVFSGIMIMILFANHLVRLLKPKNVGPAYAGLTVSLLVSYFFGPAVLTGLPFAVEVPLGTLIVLLPLFFAAIIFAVSFSRTTDAPSAFGSNLIGAVVGGFVEYASLVTGIRFLSLLGLAFYLLSLLALKKKWSLAF